MIQFNKVTLHNFGSYQHAEIDLGTKGFCLVTGRNNYAKDNALSNGSGKSFLWSAICYTITGETINGLKTNLRNINPSDDDSYTILDFNVNADHYVLTRYIAPKSDLKIIFNDNDVSGKGIRDSEKKLGELLPDVDKNLIASTIIIGQGMPNKFSSFSPSGRKELLERLTKSDFMIEDMKQRVLNRQTELNTKLREYEDSLLLLNSQLTTANKTLQEAKSALASDTPVDYDTKIAELTKHRDSINKDLAQASDDLVKAEAAKQAASDGLVNMTDEKSKTSAAEYRKYTEAFTTLNSEATEIKANCTSLKKRIIDLQSIKDVCPTCGQKLPGVEKPSTAKEEAALQSLMESLKVAADKVTACNNKHTEYLNQISTKYDQKIAELKQTLADSTKAIEKLKNDISDFTHYASLDDNELLKLQYDKENHSKYLKGLQDSIDSSQTEIASVDAAIRLSDAGKTDVLERLAVVKKMDTLIKRDFRGYLLSNIISYLDKRAKDYSEIVYGTRELNVYLDGNALDISYCGKMFDNLSGGEKQRVDLILQFAIRDMLNTYLSTSSNILVLDEITDFLDAKSCEAVMNLIAKELNTTESVFIISHHADELGLPIDSEIKIIKNAEGISEVY